MIMILHENNAENYVDNALLVQVLILTFDFFC